MNDARAEMNAALKEVLIPALRAKGFKGAFPHFRRVLSERVDYLSVQFYSSGGSFVVEIVSAGPDGKPQGYGNNLPIEKLNTQYFVNRLRLGSDSASGQRDHWYVFGPRSYDAPEPPRVREHYLRIARQVLADFESQGEPWLGSKSTAA